MDVDPEHNKNMKTLQEIQQKLGNDTCADCGSNLGVNYAAYNHGIFLCFRCANIHAEMGRHISAVKDIIRDHWEESQIERMKEMGNLNSNGEFLTNVPVGLRKPVVPELDCCPLAPEVLLNYWIRSKYELKEFTKNPLPFYLTGGEMDTYLMKKGRYSSRCSNRRFLLKADSLTLFDKENENPKNVINLVNLDVCIVTQKCGKNRDALQLSYLKEGSTRSIYVYHDDTFMLMQCYQAIRLAKLQALKKSSNNIVTENVLLELLPEDPPIEGYLLKSGANINDEPRRRWFMLLNRKLMYFVDPLDDYPEGEIFIGTNRTIDPALLERSVLVADRIFRTEIPRDNLINKLKGFKVKKGGFRADLNDSQQLIFSLDTPERTFILKADTETERDHWVDILSHLLTQQLNPRDIAVCALLQKKRMRSPIKSLRKMLKNAAI